VPYRIEDARECGVADPAAAVPVLFGREFALDRDALDAEIDLDDTTVRVPAGTDLSDPALEAQVRDALRERLDAVVPRVAETLAVPTQATRLDGGLDGWSDHTAEGTVLVHPRAAILPPDLLEHLAFRELVFYKEAVNNRSYWGEMVEQYPEYTAVSDRLLGYWLLSHANGFWNAALDQ
jgi:predicted metal-dependent hydrolase